MADYKELLRRAISALPENNGAARRAVYEKARSALVGQLRAIQPPLPARDITQHRLQLEDCIRQVEQEASEAVISLGRDVNFTPRPAAPRPQPAPAPAPTPRTPEPMAEAAAVSAIPAAAPQPAAPVPEAPVEQPEPELAAGPDAQTADDESDSGPVPVATPDAAPAPAGAGASPRSIEDIIAEAASTSGATVEPTPKVFTLTPSRSAPPVSTKPAAPVAEPIVPAAEEKPAEDPFRPEPRIVTPPAPATTPATPVEAALSSVREVDLEDSDTREAQGAIERAIETLDREARGEASAPLPDRADAPAGLADDVRTEDPSFAAAEAEPRSGAGLTIFLVVFAVLLAGVGGAGFWAWREGYVDLDQMFGRAQPAVTETAQPTQAPATPTMDNSAQNTEATTPDQDSTGPGNTATNTTSEPTSALQGLEGEDRLTPTPVDPTGNETVLPSLDNNETKSEDRLSGADTSIAADDPSNSVDPAVLAGNQSLLLEASPDGRSGAVPFSGTVEWSEGTDEVGLPTIVAKASIPARNLSVSVTIRKNSDPSLPASHLMEVNFDVTDTFAGGSISSLPGVLLKDQELVPGTPLVGASARVVGNSFLFALSSSEADVATNTDLLRNRRWLDLAVVYGTGRNAILTLEKDDEAEALFNKVFDAWQ